MRYNRRKHRRNPFLDQSLHPSALSFDPEATIQTGAFSFDPDEASSEIFSSERTDELAAQELLQAMQRDIDWQAMGKAIARSWGMPGVAGMMSQRLRRSFLSNARVRQAAQHMAETWVEETNKMLDTSRRNPRRSLMRRSRIRNNRNRRIHRNWDFL